MHGDALDAAMWMGALISAGVRVGSALKVGYEQELSVERLSQEKNRVGPDSPVKPRNRYRYHGRSVADPKSYVCVRNGKFSLSLV